MVRQWTEEERIQHAERMKAYWKNRKEEERDGWELAGYKVSVSVQVPVKLLALFDKYARTGKKPRKRGDAIRRLIEQYVKNKRTEPEPKVVKL
jgi:DNA invertase Pin-like site-specific DNA recombinase